MAVRGKRQNSPPKIKIITVRVPGEALLFREPRLLDLHAPAQMAMLLRDFPGLALLRECRPVCRNGGNLVLHAPNEPGANFVRKYMTAQIITVWRAATGQSVTVEVRTL